MLCEYLKAEVRVGRVDIKMVQQRHLFLSKILTPTDDTAHKVVMFKDFKIKTTKKEIKRAQVFNQEEQEEEESTSFQKTVNRELQEEGKRAIKTQIQAQKQLLAQDESAFEYDAVYDQMKQAQHSAKLEKLNLQSSRQVSNPLQSETDLSRSNAYLLCLGKVRGWNDEAGV